MPIIIGKESFTNSNTSYETLMAALKSLPEPKIYQPLDNPCVEVNPKKTLLMLQKEQAYIDFSNPGNNIRFLGARNLSGCIFLLITNDVDYYVAHVDSGNSLDLLKALTPFKDKKNLSVILAGGYPTSEISSIALEHIFQELFKLSEQEESSITIEMQYCMERDTFSKKEDTPYFMADKLIEKAGYFFRVFFKKELDHNRIPQFTTETLTSKSTLNEDELLGFIGILSNANYFIRDGAYENINKIKKLVLPNLTEENFYDYLSASFNKDGFDKLSMHYNLHSNFPDTRLYHFAYDTQTKAIHRLSIRFPIDYLHQRNALILDSKHKSPFRTVYRGSYPTYFTDTSISKMFFKICQKYYEIIQKKMVFSQEERDELQARFNFFETEMQIMILNNLFPIIDKRHYERIAHIKEATFPSEQFKFKTKRFNDFYTSFSGAENTILNLLNSTPSITFQGKTRTFPTHLLDAVSFVNTIAEAEEIIEIHLKPMGIKATILQFADEKTILCIPAINFGNTAKELYEKLTAEKQNQTQLTIK